MNQEKKNLDDLLAIMARLRDPDGGCPWDIEQNFKSIAPYTIEEAYEVADAIERGDYLELKQELGDLLFQVVYHSQLANEKGLFEFNEVVDTVAQKMVSRHPHVFGDIEALSSSDVNAIWEERKDQEEKRQSAKSILDDVPLALPALKRGQKLQNRAARVGFEWPKASDVLAKLDEEVAELHEAMQAGNQSEIEDELGDMFFTLTNFGRMLGLDCETVMEQANKKFSRRFKVIEEELQNQGKEATNATLEEMEALWQQAKRQEKAKA